MAFRITSRFIFNAFRRYNSRISQPILRKNVLKNSPFVDGSKRFYYVDRNQVHHFRPRWSHNPRNLGILGFLGCGYAASVYFSNLERVPYTNRSRFMFFTRSREKKIAELWFKEIKTECQDEIVDPRHPLSIKVQKIGQNIVKASQMELMCKEEERETATTTTTTTTMRMRMRMRMRTRMMNWLGKRVSSQPANLEGFKWEFVVVDKPKIVNAFCAPGGKIFVFTGLLDLFKTDAEIATIIAHEVGHGVARHYAEIISKDPWFMMSALIREMCEEPWQTISQFIFAVFYNMCKPGIAYTIISSLFLWLPYSRRMEMEADYIGLILMASAGYDPSVAPDTYNKFGDYIALLQDLFLLILLI